MFHSQWQDDAMPSCRSAGRLTTVIILLAIHCHPIHPVQILIHSVVGLGRSQKKGQDTWGQCHWQMMRQEVARPNLNSVHPVCRPIHASHDASGHELRIKRQGRIIASFETYLRSQLKPLFRLTTVYFRSMNWAVLGDELVAVNASTIQC